MENLQTKIEKLGDAGLYHEQAELFLKETGTSILFSAPRIKKHFPDDKEPRIVWDVRLKNKNGYYNFDYGMSLNDTEKFYKSVGWSASNVRTFTLMELARCPRPSAYDVLSGLISSDPGTLTEFCACYGYDFDSKLANKVYYKCCLEWESLNELFSPTELEALSYIN